MSTTRIVAVAGVGLWSPRLPSWVAACDVLAGRAAPLEVPQPRAAAALLAPTERRRAPDTVCIALEVAARACDMAGIAPDTLPSVFASTHGDLAISDYMCATLATTPALCSPTKFHNSVHNAASGYWTIGTQCVQPSTALSSWTHTFANGLLEALVQALADDTPVLYVAYDVEARGPLAQVTPSHGLLAAALVLVPVRGGAQRPVATLAWDVGDLDAPVPPPTVPPAWRSAVPDNAMIPCLPLLAAIAAGTPAQLACPLSAGCALRLSVDAA